MSTKGLRNGAIAAFVVSLALLLFGGRFARDKAPPIPGRVVGAEQTLTTRDTIRAGQDVYQRYGLMDHGSIWGHGALRGIDFAAHTLHLRSGHVRDFMANPQAPRDGAYDDAPPEARRQIDAAAVPELRENRYDPAEDVLRLPPADAYAFEKIRIYWDTLFRDGESHYGFLPDTVPTEEQRRNLADFFFWTSWAAGTQRPNASYTYTNNWPPDRAVGNTAPAQALLWSIASILALFAVLGAVVYIVHRYRFFYGEAKATAAATTLLMTPPTPSQRASAKFFLVAGLLFILQIFNGGLLAHYTVHPGSFYAEVIGRTYPFSWAKSWHLQLGILWIALSWMGTAVYLAPFVAGREPKGQRGFVNALFIAAVAVALGSLLGEVLSIKGFFGDAWFWFGHQGWEYLELGRLWQILLFAGLIFWLFVVYRAMAPVLRRGEGDADRRALILFYLFSAIFVVAFFGFGLFYGRGSHLTLADYWRWFVVHIWVESIFEFFGVAVISLFLVTLGLVSATSALRVAYLTAILVFVSGIPGTAHHYYWYGGPGFWIALGSVFSSLEPVPLILLVARAWMEYKAIREEDADFGYRWPLYFITASSVWNFIGAGMFGFMINLPIVNYYEHSTYLTSNHGHTALFGVYGMLAIALILFSWRGLVPDRAWNERLLCVSFWGLNGGLLLIFSTGLLPIGLLQVWHSYETGFWFARSAAFYELPFVQALGNWRIVPDTIIILVGAFPLLFFLLTTFPRLRPARPAGDAARGNTLPVGNNPSKRTNGRDS